MIPAPRRALFIWLAFLALCTLVLSRAQIDTDMSAFLPRTPTPAQRILVDQLREGLVSRLILIGLEGAPPATLAQTSKSMAARLRAAPEFVALHNGATQTPDPDHAFLWRNRYLLSPAVNAEHFSAAALHGALEDDVQMLGSPAGALISRVLAEDPSAELMRLIEQWQGQAQPNKRDGVWFAPDGGRALLVAQTRATGSDLDAQEIALQKIRLAYTASVAGMASPPRLLLTGPGVFAVEARAHIAGDAWRISLIATALITTLLLLLYRSPRVLILGLLPVASGAVAGIAAVSLAFGSVHGLTLGFGVTLIGEGVDYAIYLFTQITRDSRADTTLRRIWPTLRLGVLTSICGFSALLFSGFSGLAQLGWFSIVGLVIAVLTTRWVLPALLPKDFIAPSVTVLAPWALAAAAQARRLSVPLWIILLAALISLVLHRGPYWNDQLSSLSPVPLAQQQLDESMRRALGAPDVRYLIVARAASEEAALHSSEALEALLHSLIARGVLTGVDAPSRYLPSLATQAARQKALPDAADLRLNMQTAQRGLPFRAGLFAPFFTAVAAAKTQPLIRRSDLLGTSLALKVDSLLTQRADGWLAMLPLRGVSAMEEISHALRESPIPAVTLLDLKEESDALYRGYLHKALSSALAGLAIIAVLLWWNLRSVARTLRVLLPLAAAVLSVSAGLVAGGQVLTLFHLVGLLLVVAIGSNYALFFDRRDDATQERGRILASLLFANLSTVIGFGLLSFSHAPVLQAIGITVAAGTLLSLIYSAILIAPPRAAIAT